MNSLSQILNESTARIDSEMRRYLAFDDRRYAVLVDSMRYSAYEGGKRIRPFLTLAFARALGGSEAAALPYACSIEMIHTYSLIHDDLPCMDNDDFRRGKPSTHKACGESIALLAGDAMMLKAIEIIVNSPSLSQNAKTKAISVLLEGAGENGMLAGQAMDTDSSHSKLTLSELIELHHLKTGKLILASAKLGCLSANIGPDDQRYEAIMKYAENIGLAFQIVDDILDYKEGKSEDHSFIAFMSLEEATNYATQLTKEAISEIQPYDNGTLTELAQYLTIREY